jgi:class 3 adenylate cyclase/PAS domain-containing protein
MLKRAKKTVYDMLRDDGRRSLANRLISHGIMALILINVLMVVIEAMRGFPERQSQLQFYIEAGSVFVFTLEYLLRLWTANLIYPKMKPIKAYLTYVFSPMALVDIVAILPFYLPFALPVSPVILRLLRMLRLMRLFKMNRYADAATSKTILSSIRDSIVVLDLEQNVLSLNDSAKKLFGVDDAAKNLHVSDIQAWPSEISLTGEEKSAQTIDFEMPGDKFYSATISPILAKEHLLKYVITIRDVTETVLLERAEKERIKGVFGRFVSPDVVKELVEGNVDIQLGGSVKEISVLFVDIRGFTAFSEVNPPEKVVAMVNKYLGLTSVSIQENGGMIDKYIGDATMAIFNAPHDLQDHPLYACKAAWAMKQGAAAIQKEIFEQYGVDLKFGVGVNTGNAVIGNMGSDFRMDYTAIGDTVNTAARLEANAKGGQIIISDATYQQVKDHVEVTDLGILNVKNKKVSIQIYSLDNVLM